MLQNYLKIALRNLSKRKAFSFINIAGLAIGMACALLIFLSVRQDLAFDQGHAKADRIFRVLTIDEALGVTSTRVGITLPALGPTMKAELPEVEEAVRLNSIGRQLLSVGDKDLYAESTILAEPTFFDVFDFPLRAGDPATALAEPNTVVLTETMARRLFGDDEALGQTIRLNHDTDVRVTGIAADPPVTSSLQFDLLQSLVPGPDDDQQGLRAFLDSWNSISLTTFVVLRDPATAESLLPRMEEIIRRNEVGENFSVTLQPLADVHLRSSDILFDESTGKSDQGYVYGLSAVAIFVLLIACFNFMNLATARSAERAREVGLRKTMGANRTQLIWQHLGESLFLCALAFVVAFGLVAASLPAINAALNKQLALGVLADPVFVLLLIGVALFVALLAGAYPAFVLSQFEPATVLKGSFQRSTRGGLLRRALVVTQFTASVVMIIGALVVSDQLGFIMQTNMGYQRDQVLVLELGDPQLQRNGEALEAALRRDPAIADVAQASSVPGRQLGRRGVLPEGASEDDTWIISAFGIDEHFIPMMGMELAAGRNFSPAFGTDTTEAVLLNEAAVRAFGWTDAVGKHLTYGETERTVVGVVKDFHYASVRHQVEPLMMLYQPRQAPLLAVKLRPTDLPQTLAAVEGAWREVNPDYPFEYSFLDQEFARQYQEEANFARLSRGFTILAIIVACLGLFGLATFTAEQRRKEIGVRKVLGASVPGLVALLSKDFLALVGVAFVIAAPLAYFVMRDWLADFAYRIALGPGVFLLAGGLALAIALLTVSYQALRAATTDPVKALRYE